jgi:hypothetical protein
MSIEEFLLAFASIVVGLGLSDLLHSLHRLLRAGRKVKWDWLTLAFAALAVFIAVTLWWFSFYWLFNVRSVTMVTFLPKLLFLCVGFLMMAAALPDEIPNEGIVLRDFYMSSRFHRWSLVFVLVLLNIVLLSWTAWSSFVESARDWPLFISAALAAASSRSTRVWLHVLTIGWIGAVTAKSVLFISITTG